MSQWYSRLGRSRLSCLVTLALVMQPLEALASPPVVTAPAPVGSATAIRAADVALQQGNALQGQVLRGQVVSSAGVGMSGVTVELSDGQQQWQVLTNSQGWFQLADLRGGSYRIQAAGQACPLRAWAAGTAPPHASQGLLMIPQTDVVRGQRVVSANTNQFFRVAKRRLANPWVVGGVVLTAVAIPVAIHNGDDDDPPASP